MRRLSSSWTETRICAVALLTLGITRRLGTSWFQRTLHSGALASFTATLLFGTPALPVGYVSVSAKTQNRSGPLHKLVPSSRERQRQRLWRTRQPFGLQLHRRSYF